MTAKILIVDDSGLARRSTRQLLEGLGHEVTEAADGARALELFFLNPPDAVILDMVMTGMYGLEVLARMRELQPDVKVIVATADIQESTAALVRAAGAKGMLNKPVGREKLSAALGAVLAGGESWS